MNAGFGSMLRGAADLLIRGYQLALSPVLGTNCRFYPSCSEYTRLAIRKHGFWKGCGYGIWRLAKCHPLHPGGVDPVP